MTVLELAKLRKQDELESLSPKVREAVALHCMRLSIRVRERIQYKTKYMLCGNLCVGKAMKKYRVMFEYYDRYVNDVLEEYIEAVVSSDEEGLKRVA